MKNSSSNYSMKGNSQLKLYKSFFFSDFSHYKHIKEGKKGYFSVFTYFPEVVAEFPKKLPKADSFYFKMDKRKQNKQTNKKSHKCCDGLHCFQQTYIIGCLTEKNI